MCGITGISSPFLDKDKLISATFRMLKAQNHRGPDSSGHALLGNNTIFGHNRLSIIDLSPSGHQPMSSSSNRYSITFNGEIYNYKELKETIEKEFNYCNWIGSSDTEVLLQLIEFSGIDKAVEMIDGMFAIAIFDSLKNKIYLIRDRLGEKPIYYHLSEENKFFIFSSELKALKAAKLQSFKLNKSSVDHYLSYGHTPRNISIYDEILKVLPGQLIEIDVNSFFAVKRNYWSAASFIQSKKIKNDFEAIRGTEKLLKKSISKQLRADVPVGSFLSGGVDSSLVTAMMQDVSSSCVNTFSIGFENSEYDESEHAAKVASHLKTNHSEIKVTHQDLLDRFMHINDIYDEPFSDSSQIVTKIVAEHAKEKVKVVLTGDGGDEVFGGYNRHKVIQSFWPRIQSVPIQARKVLFKLFELVGTKKTAKLIELLSLRKDWANLEVKLQKASIAGTSKNIEEFYLRLYEIWNDKDNIKNFNPLPKQSLSLAITNESNLSNIMHWDLINFLPDDILTKVDRATMSASLESRAPLLDRDLIEYALSLPDIYKVRKVSGKWVSKWALREVLYKYVPQQLIDRPKMGFSIPIDDWLRGPLKSWSEKILSRDKIADFNLVNYEVLKKTWNEHQSGRKDWGTKLWNILVLQQWLERGGFE